MSSAPFLGLLGVIFGALITGIFAWVTAKVGKTSAVDTFMANLMSSLEQERGRLGKVEKRMDAAVKRERVRDDYILELRRHIVEGKPPPPPDWPPMLLQWDEAVDEDK